MIRFLKLEGLESRFVFDSSWHNGELPCDVDRSGTVAAVDALIIINELNQNGARALVSPQSEQFLFDTNNDQLLTPSMLSAVSLPVICRDSPMHRRAHRKKRPPRELPIPSLQHSIPIANSKLYGTPRWPSVWPW
jgi:hypothetical protein